MEFKNPCGFHPATPHSNESGHKHLQTTRIKFKWFWTWYCLSDSFQFKMKDWDSVNHSKRVRFSKPKTQYLTRDSHANSAVSSDNSFLQLLTTIISHSSVIIFTDNPALTSYLWVAPVVSQVSHNIHILLKLWWKLVT